MLMYLHALPLTHLPLVTADQYIHNTGGADGAWGWRHGEADNRTVGQLRNLFSPHTEQEAKIPHKDASMVVQDIAFTNNKVFTSLLQTVLAAQSFHLSNPLLHAHLMSSESSLHRGPLERDDEE